GIRDVRNLLIAHPEQGKPAPNYKQQLVVTDDGPVLKGALGVKIIGGRVEPLEDELDRGLYINAEGFRGELQARLMEALA
ncbi:MAG: hypothetical protein ACRD1T_26575, partial [Acidimicrobiia bacterium]